MTIFCSRSTRFMWPEALQGSSPIKKLTTETFPQVFCRKNLLRNYQPFKLVVSNSWRGETAWDAAKILRTRGVFGVSCTHSDHMGIMRCDVIQVETRANESVYWSEKIQGTRGQNGHNEFFTKEWSTLRPFGSTRASGCIASYCRVNFIKELVHYWDLQGLSTSISSFLLSNMDMKLKGKLNWDLELFARKPLTIILKMKDKENTIEQRCHNCFKRYLYIFFYIFINHGECERKVL